MKKRLFAVLTALAFGAVCFAQEKTSDEYQKRYALLVNRLGNTGVGIETLIQSWEADFPEDVKMYIAKFNYYYNKAQETRLVRKDSKKFMGADPVLNLTDSLGQEARYFEEVVFDDSLYAIATQALDQAIKYDPDNIGLRFGKITALMGYEKDSPDMAFATLKNFIEYNYSSNPKWLYEGAPMDNEIFISAIQEYCYSFYLIGSPMSQECFREISEKMLKYNPNNLVFLANIGSYYLTVKNNTKEALKYYNKVLKLDPTNYAAIKNCVIIARKNKDVKLEKKYLPMLARFAETQVEKQQAEARLKALTAKKK